MFLFVYNVAMYYIPYSFLPPIAAVITLEGLARVAVRHAEAAEHGDHADAAQAGEVRAATGGAFREVVERIQAGFVALGPFKVFSLASLIFFLIKERVVVDVFFSDGFWNASILPSTFLPIFYPFPKRIMIFSSPLQF